MGNMAKWENVEHARKLAARSFSPRIVQYLLTVLEHNFFRKFGKLKAWHQKYQKTTWLIKDFHTWATIPSKSRKCWKVGRPIALTPYRAVYCWRCSNITFSRISGKWKPDLQKVSETTGFTKDFHMGATVLSKNRKCWKVGRPDRAHPVSCSLFLTVLGHHFSRRTCSFTNPRFHTKVHQSQQGLCKFHTNLETEQSFRGK